MNLLYKLTGFLYWLPLSKKGCVLVYRARVWLWFTRMALTEGYRWRTYSHAGSDWRASMDRRELYKGVGIPWDFIRSFVDRKTGLYVTQVFVTQEEWDWMQMPF